MRSIADIDDDINVERGILEYDRRGGRTCPDAAATLSRIDRLLDERNAAMGGETWSTPEEQNDTPSTPSGS